MRLEQAAVHAHALLRKVTVTACTCDWLVDHDADHELRQCIHSHDVNLKVRVRLACAFFCVGPVQRSALQLASKDGAAQQAQDV